MANEPEKIQTDAAIWLARLERGLSERDAAALRAWLKSSEQRDAIVEAAKLYHGPDIVAVLAQMVPVGFGTAPPPPIIRRKHPLVPLLVVALFFATIVLPLRLIHRKMPGVLDIPPPPAVPGVPWLEDQYATGASETRAIRLPDGSQVTLHERSQLEILYGPTTRLATLSRGEAIFQVAAEHYRPFEVSAAGHRFRAPPSRFDVRVLDARGVELTVADGDVTVQALPWRWPATPAEARVFDPRVFADMTVGPEQVARLEDTTLSEYHVTAANLRTRMGWQPEDVFYITPITQ